MTGFWLAVRVEPSGDPQPVIEALFAAGSHGIQELPGAIVTHFPPGARADQIRRAVSDVDSSASVTCSETPPADWSEWRASVSAHRVDRITIAPPWHCSADDTIHVVIDPAMAFGTGEHATTRGVVRLMQRLPEMPDTVADLGAGSAVLSICAAKLGASRVVAIELDGDAIENAEENVRVNRAGGTVSVIEGDAAVLLPLIAPVGLVLANIISSVLLTLLPVIASSLVPGGHAILSGVLTSERTMMMSALARGGWSILHEDVEDEWWSVLIARPR